MLVHTAQADKEVHKCVELMREMEADMARKRFASKRVKVRGATPRGGSCQLLACAAAT